MNRVSTDILQRVYILFGLFLLFGGLVVLRILGLQWNENQWVEKEHQGKIIFKKMVADRGNILADDGTILATSIPFYRIAMDPMIIDTSRWENFDDSLRQLAANLANFFGDEVKDTLLYYNRIRSAFSREDRHVYLSRKKVNFHELEQIRQWPIINKGRLGGGFCVDKFDNERFYPLGDLARITLGRLVDDTMGIRGIEASYNRELRGRDGYVLAQEIVGESYVPLDQFGEEKATDGYDVRTTLDVDMQDIVEEALKKGVDQNFAKFGTAILMDVESGAIKAIANYPETYNYAVAFQYEPGSTFKTAAAAALMEDDLIRLCDSLDTGDGTILFDDKEITDNGKAHGAIDFEHIFALSSNVGMAMAVNQHYVNSPDRYVWHLKNFGFGDVSNTQLIGEPNPRMIEPSDSSWTIATLPSLAYGYSIMVTPLQMAAFYNGMANGGKLMRPWLVQELRNDSKVVKEFGPEVWNPQMCQHETTIKVREMMKSVVNYGTASKAFRKMPFEVAGKTGTVRKNINGRYVKLYRASFGGYFPADAPRFTLFVMVDEPNGGSASGGKVAAPIFRNIAEAVWTMDQKLSRPPSSPNQKAKPLPVKGLIYAQSADNIYKELGITTSNQPDAEWYGTESNGHQVNLSKLEKTDRVPDLKGMSGRDALHLMEQMGVKVRIQGTGRVVRQSLLPGYRLGEGAAITLFCS